MASLRREETTKQRLERITLTLLEVDEEIATEQHGLEYKQELREQLAKEQQKLFKALDYEEATIETTAMLKRVDTLINNMTGVQDQVDRLKYHTIEECEHVTNVLESLRIAKHHVSLAKNSLQALAKTQKEKSERK